MNAISPVRPFIPPVEIRPAVSPETSGSIPAAEIQKALSASPASQVSEPAPVHETFGNLLSRFVDEVDSKQAAAGETVSALLRGENVPLHQAMIAMEEASVSFQLMVEVRNKLLESYQELMRMQV